MKYVVFYESAENVAERAPAYFAAHSARGRAFHARGELLMYGVFGDPQAEGSMAVFTTRQAAEEFVEGDPFVLNGVVRGWTIREWREVLFEGERPVSERATGVVAQIEALRREVVSVVEPLTEAQWRATTAAEGWPVGFAARHIAAGCGQATEWVQAGVDGRPMQMEPELIHARNAEHLTQHGGVARAEVLAMLRERFDALASLAGGLTDAQLALPALVSPAGQRSVEEVATALLAMHSRNHLESIRATLTSA